LLALGQRFPGQEVVQILVAVADEHGPEAGLPDAVLLPDLGRVVLEALEQRRQAAGHAAIDAILVDHGRSPRWTTGRSSSAAAVGTSRVAACAARDSPARAAAVHRPPSSGALEQRAVGRARYCGM